MVWLTSCTTNPITNHFPFFRKYPVIPLPANANYYAKNSWDNQLTKIIFIFNQNDFLFDSEIATYFTSLEQQGWKLYKGNPCQFVMATDIRFSEVYKYGDRVNPPMVMIGVNGFPTQPGSAYQGYEVSLFLKNCGTVQESQGATPSTEGCVILLPQQTSTTAP